MGDSVPDGSRIRIRWTGGDYHPGQIVACLDHGFLFAHRIVHVRRDTIVTRGDGWILCDPPLPVSEVIGEVITCCVDGIWRPPAVEAARSLSGARAARRQVCIIAACLRVSPAFSRFITRRMIGLYTFREYCRHGLATVSRRLL